MSLQQLKANAADLPDAERRELLAYLVALGRSRDDVYWQKVEAQIGDRDPQHWVRGEDLNRALGLDRDAR